MKQKGKNLVTQSLSDCAIPPHKAPCSSSGTPHTWPELQYDGFGNAGPRSTVTYNEFIRGQHTAV